MVDDKLMHSKEPNTSRKKKLPWLFIQGAQYGSSNKTVEKQK